MATSQPEPLSSLQPSTRDGLARGPCLGRGASTMAPSASPGGLGGPCAGTGQGRSPEG